MGPQHREFRKEILQAMQVGVWAPTQRISKRNSTGNASWRGPNTENFEKKFYRQCKLAGPQHREFRKEILQAMQVGVWAPTQRNWISNFYRQCKLGCGPQHREFRKEILQAMQVGVGQRNKFCENIISVPLPYA
ncbi:hypothetical protein V797_00678 [Staphylococcus aureus H88188]|nr:hypothetical protein V797_00678 [Staphylococcus aureus H88188]